MINNRKEVNLKLVSESRIACDDTACTEVSRGAVSWRERAARGRHGGSATTPSTVMKPATLSYLSCDFYCVLVHVRDK